MAGSSTSPAVGRTPDVLVRLAEGPGPVRAATLARDLGLGVVSFEIGCAYLRHEPLERRADPVSGER